MCARLGIRQAFSQAYRPQANGRAEAAVRQVKLFLRRLYEDGAVKWVEALPRVLRFIHDLVGESGYSPYQIMFGRHRPLAGLPYSSVHENPEANASFDRIKDINAEHKSYLCFSFDTGLV